jgi:Lrp/AsnC family transcriptional regulator for asnA, asnC and gidA
LTFFVASDILAHEKGGKVAYELNSMDRQIISLLQRDGRTPNVDIARRLGVSEATVRKRLDRLVSEGIIHITAIPNPGKVGYATVTFLTFDVDLAQVDHVTDQLARSPEVRAIYYTSGQSDLIVEAWFPSGDALLHFLTQRVASIPGIKGTATSHVLRTIQDGSHWILPSPNPPRILIVDDDPDFVDITRRALAGEGFEVATANCGEAALAIMRVSRPDVVILDIMIRGVLDGLRTAREMRSDGDLRAVPILLVSSISQSTFGALLPQQESLPADNLLVKPVDHALLIGEIRRLLRSTL